eukprot:2626341-Pleurochrysis_carterae.AAC.1
MVTTLARVPTQILVLIPHIPPTVASATLVSQLAGALTCARANVRASLNVSSRVYVSVRVSARKQLGAIATTPPSRTKSLVDQDGARPKRADQRKVCNREERGEDGKRDEVWHDADDGGHEGADVGQRRHRHGLGRATVGPAQPASDALAARRRRRPCRLTRRTRTRE